MIKMLHKSYATEQILAFIPNIVRAYKAQQHSNNKS